MALALSGASPRLVAIAALCALAGLSQHAQATNGYFAHGYGIQSEGIAGVGIALPQDSLAAATNPAGTAFVGSRLDIGLNYFEPSRSARIEGNNLGPWMASTAAMASAASSSPSSATRACSRLLSAQAWRCTAMAA